MPLPFNLSFKILCCFNRHSPNHLATLSFLCHGLSRFELISERRFYPGQVPLLDSLLESPSSSSPVLFLFPTPDSVDLSEWVQSIPLEKRTEPVLVVVDGTWSQASEMTNNSLPFLSQLATCVSLGGEVKCLFFFIFLGTNARYIR